MAIVIICYSVSLVLEFRKICARYKAAFRCFRTLEAFLQRETAFHHDAELHVPGCCVGRRPPRYPLLVSRNETVRESLHDRQVALELCSLPLALCGGM